MDITADAQVAPKIDRRHDPRVSEANRALALMAKKELADAAAAKVGGIVLGLYRAGKPLIQIAAEMNKAGLRGRSGRAYCDMAVRRILIRIGEPVGRNLHRPKRAPGASLAQAGA